MVLESRSLPLISLVEWEGDNSSPGCCVCCVCCSDNIAKVERDVSTSSNPSCLLQRMNVGDYLPKHQEQNGALPWIYLKYWNPRGPRLNSGSSYSMQGKASQESQGLSTAPPPLTQLLEPSQSLTSIGNPFQHWQWLQRLSAQNQSYKINWMELSQ